MIGHGYSYVVVRQDLSPAQRAVQSCHASIEMARRFLKKDQEHPSVIIVVVKNETKLKAVLEEAKTKGIQCIEFHEPDRGNEMTAFATEPLVGEERAMFRRFQLLT